MTFHKAGALFIQLQQNRAHNAKDLDDLLLSTVLFGEIL